MKRWFENVETLQELKAEFRRLALEFHPDHGGDAAVMRDIIFEYQKLVKILPDIPVECLETTDEAGEPENMRETARPNMAYCPTTAGGANPHLPRLATPLYSHERICSIAKTLFVYSGQSGSEDLREFYRKLCRDIDPAQWLPYRDYLFNPKIARQSVKFVRERVLNRIFTPALWSLVKKSQENLNKAA